MTLLAIDTAASNCAAALADTDTGAILGLESRDIGRGHAEQLMDVVSCAMEQAGKDWQSLSRLAVTVGPGSFTGIRVGVAAARGLALALQIPLNGITTLEALMWQTRADKANSPVLCVLDARRDEVYAQAFAADGQPETEPAAMHAEAAVRLLVSGMVLAGSGAQLVADASGRDDLVIASLDATPGITAVAALALAQPVATVRPGPLYLRPADARPQQGFVLPRLAGEP